MGPWQHYLIVLKQDLIALAWMLTWVGGALLVHSALIAISAAARHRRLLPRVIWIAILIAWLVSTFAAVGSYLLGWGLVLQLYRTWGVSSAAVPQRFWMALGCVSIAIAVILSYRHTAAWLKACTYDKRAPMRASFSLGTLLLYQLILLLGLGLWIECRRDWVKQQYEKQVRLAEEQARMEAFALWEKSLEERFDGHGWSILHSQLDDPVRCLDLILAKGDNQQNIDAAILDRLRPEDGLRYLDTHSDNMTGETLKHLTNHKSLTVLHIVAPKITDDDVAHLAQMPRLRNVILKCPKLTDRALDSLSGINARIWIESPHLTQAAVEAHNKKREGNWVSLLDPNYLPASGRN